jgi:hypothetical protein
MPFHIYLSVISAQTAERARGKAEAGPRYQRVMLVRLDACANGKDPVGFLFTRLSDEERRDLEKTLRTEDLGHRPRPSAVSRTSGMRLIDIVLAPSVATCKRGLRARDLGRPRRPEKNRAFMWQGPRGAGSAWNRSHIWGRGAGRRHEPRFDGGSHSRHRTSLLGL